MVVLIYCLIDGHVADSVVKFFIRHHNCTHGHMVDTTFLAYIPYQILAYNIHLSHDNYRST